MNGHGQEPAESYDVAVVGGGAAGLSAAVALLRFGRSVIVNDDGTPRSFSGVAWDISEYKRAEQALHESAEELRLITDALPALIGYVDAEQRYRFVNRHYEPWFARPVDQLIGRTLREVMTPEVYAERERERREREMKK